jgi:steroid 5-alpha reductase family enzyme
MMTSLWFLALTLASFLMLLTWLTSVKIRNAGIVDIVWSAGFTPLVWLYVALGYGWMPRKLLIAGMVSFWSLRLGGYLFRRIKSHHPQEDERYADFRRKWGETFDRKMFGFFQIQAALLWVLTLPFLLSCLNTKPSFHALEFIGLAIWAMGLIGESTADFQLSRFVSKPENRGRICQAGLWRYSRHPNYFFEWTIWIGYFVFALAQPNGWWSVYCPLLMLHFLYNVTGVKLSERGSLARRGDAYREYQRTTSAFVPWFPKKDASR